VAPCEELLSSPDVRLRSVITGYAPAMTTPSGDAKNSAKTAETKSTDTTSKANAGRTARERTGGEQANTETFSGTPTEAARNYLHAPVDVAPIGFVLGDDVMQAWATQIKADPRYAQPDPDGLGDGAASSTGSAGGAPMPALIVQYGPGSNDYISTVFDSGQAIVQNGADPTGKAWKYPEADFRRFVAAVRGEPIPLDERASGPTMFEAAAEQNQRTGELLQADREAAARARQRVDEQVR
jgi:hypothetical protein